MSKLTTVPCVDTNNTGVYIHTFLVLQQESGVYFCSTIIVSFYATIVQYYNIVFSVVIQYYYSIPIWSSKKDDDEANACMLTF